MLIWVSPKCTLTSRFPAQCILAAWVYPFPWMWEGRRMCRWGMYRTSPQLTQHRSCCWAFTNASGNSALSSFVHWEILWIHWPSGLWIRVRTSLLVILLSPDYFCLLSEGWYLRGIFSGFWIDFLSWFYLENAVSFSRLIHNIENIRPEMIRTSLSVH